jgi:hypothetical protein
VDFPEPGSPTSTTIRITDQHNARYNPLIWSPASNTLRSRRPILTA